MTIIELVVALHVLLENLVRRVAFEKGSPCQNNIEDDAHAEHVRLAVVALLLEELRRNVAWRAAAHIKLLVSTCQPRCEAKICNDHVPVVLL